MQLHWQPMSLLNTDKKIKPKSPMNASHSNHFHNWILQHMPNRTSSFWLILLNSIHWKQRSINTTLVSQGDTMVNSFTSETKWPLNRVKIHQWLYTLATTDFPPPHSGLVHHLVHKITQEVITKIWYQSCTIQGVKVNKQQKAETDSGEGEAWGEHTWPELLKLSNKLKIKKAVGL